uniref:phage tail protein n=1 Tax=Scandinavium goeteborgense TaxID=1851514 RepID=UPI001357E792|nr:phage tail protein [Scandinavium goeteborgense]
MSDYYLLITDAGKALEVAAHASGEPVSLTDFAVGDGGGSPVTPDATQTALTNETFRDVLSSLNVSVTDASVLEAECIIPASSSGGYTIREIGIFASDGTLYAVGNFAEQEKPAPDSGYAASLKILADLVVSDTRDITLTVQDGSYLTETQADTIYLRQDKRLSEIAGQGAEAQQEARQHLGLKSAATADVQTSKDDTTAGRVLVNGGAIAVRSTKANATGGDVADANDLPSNSVGFVYGGAVNSPVISGSVLDFSGLSGEYNVQLAASYSGGNSFKFRTRNGDSKTWNAWYEFYHTGKKPTASDVKALPITGGTLTGDLYVQSGTSKTIGLYTRPTPSSGMGIELWGSETRPTVLEFKDEDGYHFYSQRNSDGSITISSAGIFSPSSYSNFDSRYQAKGSYYTTSQSDDRYIGDIHFGASTSHSVSNNQSFSTSGYALTGFMSDGSNDDVDTLYAKVIQKLNRKTGVWTTIAG